MSPCVRRYVCVKSLTQSHDQYVIMFPCVGIHVSCEVVRFVSPAAVSAEVPFLQLQKYWKMVPKGRL